VAFRSGAATERLGELNPGLERFIAMPSTVIRRFDYSPDSRQLTVEFVTGRRYVYSGVPSDDAEAMRQAFSKGIFFNTRIRDRYPFHKVA
jgi:hypothetical protein